MPPLSRSTPGGHDGEPRRDPQSASSSSSSPTGSGACRRSAGSSHGRSHSAHLPSSTPASVRLAKNVRRPNLASRLCGESPNGRARSGEPSRPSSLSGRCTAPGGAAAESRVLVPMRAKSPCRRIGGWPPRPDPSARCQAVGGRGSRLPRPRSLTFGWAFTQFAALAMTLYIRPARGPL